MLSVFPKNNEDLDGIINTFSSQLNISIRSNADTSSKHCPIYRSCGLDNSWAPAKQYDWLEIDFNDDLLYLTHYSITGRGRGYRVKGWHIDAKDKNGVTHRIDTVNNALPGSMDIEVRNIKKHGPFSSFNFTITDTHQITEKWYSAIYGLGLFGVTNPSAYFLNKIFKKSCKIYMKAHSSLVPFIFACISAS